MSFPQRVQTTALRLRESPATYPVTTFWVGAGTVVWLALQGNLTLTGALLINTGLMIILVLMSFAKSLRVVHDLVNSTNTVQLNRINQLTKTLRDNDIEVPPEPAQEVTHG